MDTVTQIALGATIGDAGFRKQLGRKGLLFGGLCGLLPDLDVLYTGSNPWATLIYHRAATHSLVLLPVAALIVGYLAWRAARRWTDHPGESPTVWIQLAFFSLMTHPLLDVCTMYGTQLLAPFDRTRFAIDAVSIIDPIYSLPLLGAIAIGGFRLLPAERSQKISRIVLVFTTLYLAVGFAQSQWVKVRAEKQLEAAGFQPEKLRAVPTLFNNVVYRVVARNERDDTAVALASNLYPSQKLRFAKFEWPEDSALEAAMETEEADIFEWFADGFLRAEVESKSESGTEVQIVDIKYGGFSDLSTVIFGAVFNLSDSGEIVRADRASRSNMDVGAELEALWDTVFGAQPPIPPGAEPLTTE
jgi:inner membrane protein